ncbi:TraB/GumN family protein [Thetidibacter halocola]|uniref:TraB/GumN family protein n=1 Tax=Thetidibacter halocola TaxID=2827239 RepID=A0A8J7WE65_9RHOB|nr:TraB/GumN family protein [Thetidibacter halocola]MBS0124739.1 TraB/GumN family protein [Thetidibacter halocola]
MTRLLTALLIWLGLTLPALAACSGQDLRATLNADERRMLTTMVEGRPFPAGNHWRATRDGSVLHLVGTMHLDDPRFDAIMDRIDPLIDEADAVLLEVTDREEAQLQASLATRPELLVLTESSLPDLMGDDWDALAEAMRARGLPPVMAAKMRPWYVAMLLSMPTCIDLASAKDGGLDSRIEARAGAAEVPTRALEPFDTAFNAFAETPIETQVSMLRAALIPEGAADDLFATLLASYFDEAHAESWAVTEVLAPRFGILDDAENRAIFAAMDDALLAGRNRAWIPVILDTLDQADGPVVAAFGAAHLSGPDGVLALLEAEGFTLERLAF